MMKPHCDRCDTLIEEDFQTWVEYPYVADKHIYHVQIHEGGDVRNLYEKMYCKECFISILLAVVNNLSISLPKNESSELPTLTDNDIPF